MPRPRTRTPPPLLPRNEPIYLFPAEPAGRKEQMVNELAARVSRTLGVAQALAENGRRLDLTGFEDGVGILCAQTLDLPTPDARGMLPVLCEVLAKLDRLHAALQREAPLRGSAEG